MKWLYLSVLLLFSNTSIASVMNNNHLDSCFIQAGKRYLIAPELLKTIAQQESGLVATAINHNKNKSGYKMVCGHKRTLVLYAYF